MTEKGTCKTCLRNKITVYHGIAKSYKCEAFLHHQNPCWGYIDDKAEYDKRTQERKDHLARFLTAELKAKKAGAKP